MEAKLLGMDRVNTDRWFVYTRPNTKARLRLFCFPFAGGAASLFRTWSTVLPPEVEIYPVQPPGREGRLAETPFTEIAPLVETLGQVLRPHLQLPFAFFGHSMGALISFELARQLRRQSSPAPVHLFVSGHRAPQLPDPRPPIYDLPHDEFIHELRQFNGTPEAVLQNRELLELLMSLLRADLQLVETYAYAEDEPLSSGITALGGLQDPLVTRAELDAWRLQTRGDFSLRVFPGDHFCLLNNSPLFLQTLAHDLRMLVRRIP